MAKRIGRDAELSKTHERSLSVATRRCAVRRHQRIGVGGSGRSGIRLSWRRAGGGLVGVFLVVQVGAAVSEADQIQQLERAQAADEARAAELGREAGRLETEIAGLNDQLIAKAARAQELEDRLSTIEANLVALRADERAKSRALRDRHAELQKLIAGLQRIALQPLDAFLVAPGSPIDTVRGAMLLAVAVPAMKERARALGAELNSLKNLRAEISRERAQVSSSSATLESERRELAALLARKQALLEETDDERRAAAKSAKRLAAEARNLRELIARVEREAADQAEKDAQELAVAALGTFPLDMPEDIRPFPAVPTGLVMPARGSVVVGYGQVTDNVESKGISVATRNNAQVVAPYGGKVVYAGHFRGYGQILIIEHGGRYHSLLAGLERMDAVPGQWVLTGEPVGVMGSPGRSNPELYFELRRTGQPINPLPWLVKTDNKVRG